MERNAPTSPLRPPARIPAAVLLWLSLASGAHAQEPADAPMAEAVDPSAKITVSVARMPLPAGKKLGWDDLTTVDLPRGLVPLTAVVKGTDLVGRVLAHPVALQSPIVGQRLQGWVAPPEPAPELAATVQVEWNLGPMGALIQAGDVVVWAQAGPQGCRIAQGEVLSRGAMTTLEVRAAEAEALAKASDPHVMLRGPGATTGVLDSCVRPPEPEPDAETP